MKKRILTLVLASFIISNISLTASALDNKATSTKVKKVSITKTHKQRKQSDVFKYDYINYDWWNNYNDPILTGYIEKAIKNNYDLKMASIAVEEYYQMVKLQFANELPSVGANFAPGVGKLPGATNGEFNFALPIYASYEVDILLKNHDKTASVKKDYEAYLQDERATYISMASAIGTTYLNIVKLDKMIELQEEIVQDRKIIYDLMVLRNKEGLTSTSDTVKANKAYIAGNTNLIEYKKARAKLLNQLAVLIGENPNNAEELTRISFDDLKFIGFIPEEISSDVIMNRPDYKKAEIKIEKAKIDVRVAKKEFLPTLNIGGLALFLNRDFGSLFSTKGMLAGVGGGLGWPIFTGGSRFANLNLKKAQAERVLNNYYQTNLTAIKEVNDTLITIKKDEEKYQDSVKQAKLERQDFSFTTNKYNEGMISKLDLTQAKENILFTDLQVVNNKVDCLVNYIGLYKVTGSQL